MIRVLPVLLQLALLVFCLVDCIQTPSQDVRNLPRWAWIVLILLVPLVGGIAWLLAGRPRRSTTARAPWPSGRSAGAPGHERPRRPVAPDDDPDFLRSLQASNREHEQLLEQWERDLRRREQQLRPGDGADGAGRGDDEQPPGPPPGTPGSPTSPAG